MDMESKNQPEKKNQDREIISAKQITLLQCNKCGLYLNRMHART